MRIISSIEDQEVIKWSGIFKDTQQRGQYTLGTLGNLGLSSLGLSYPFISQTGNFQAMISALATRNKVNILSPPRLTVLDNREATIQVGQDVPTVTSEIASAAAHVDLGNQCCKEYPVPQHGCHVKG